MSDVDQAVAALAEHGDNAKVLAGGTAVSILRRARLIDVPTFVSIGGIESLRGIRGDGEHIELGALATLDEVARHPRVRENFPGLAVAFGVVGNIRVRCAATVGGLLAEADYASDPPCALLALDAEVVIAGPAGRRTLKLDDFLVGFYETALAPDELVVAVKVPLASRTQTSVYEKFRTRSSEDRPCVGVFAATSFDSAGTCSDLRLAVGATSETPKRFTDVEATANARPLDEELAGAIADEYAGRIEPIDDARGSAWYRTEMVRVWVRRTLLACARQA